MPSLSLESKSCVGQKSTLIIRNITIGGRRTSVRLEPELWMALSTICHRERVSIHFLCTCIRNHKSPQSPMTAAIRVFIVEYLRIMFELYRQKNIASHELPGMHGEDDFRREPVAKAAFLQPKTFEDVDNLIFSFSGRKLGH